MTVAGQTKLTAYELQVLIGTTISGCNMSPDRTFDLPAAWARLKGLGLIDRADGIANATPAGVELVASLLAELQHRRAESDNPLISYEGAEFTDEAGNGLVVVRADQHRREAEAGSVSVPVAKLLELREALVEQNGNEAYHVLYSMADPLFERLDPWDKWEAVRAASPSSPASGVRVTEAMLDKALIAQHENDPAWKKRYDATAIRLRTEDMTRALIAALGEHP